MVLCPNHHDEATQGVMKETAQRQYKTDPYNKAHGYAGGMLTVEQNRCEINIGGSVGMLGEGSLIEVDHEPLLYITVGEQGTLLVNVSLYDQADNLLATISENEWSTENPFPWDIDFGYRDLTVRSAARSIDLSIDARRTPVEVRANLWRRGKHIKLGADGVAWTGGGGISRLSTEGLAIQISTISDTVTLGPQRKMPLRTRDQRVGRNEPCWCGSGKKLKRCHGARVGS
jgi:SEC-C motif